MIRYIVSNTNLPAVSSSQMLRLIPVIWFLFTRTQNVIAIINLDIVSPGVLGNVSASSITLGGPAFALSIANLRGMLAQWLNISHIYLYDEKIPDCVTFQNEVQNILARWYYTIRVPDNPLAIITPGCIESAQINQLAAAWNVLFISTANTDPILHNKVQSPTWVTTNLYPSSYYGDVFCRLMDINNWQSIEILLDENSAGFYTQTARLTNAALKAKQLEVANTVYSSAKIKFDFRLYLDNFRTRNRVLLFLGRPAQLRRLLINAHLMNMTDGSYVYIATLPFVWRGYGNFSWENHDEDDEIVREAYGSLLLVTMIDLLTNSSANLASFMSKWTDLYRKVPFYRNMNLETDLVLPQLTSNTAALEVFGQVLKKMMSGSGVKLHDGTAMADEIINQTFHTSLGSISFDRTGERQPLLITTSYFDPTSNCSVVFLRSEIKDGEFEWQYTGPVRWHKATQLPPSKPLCGYMDEISTYACKRSGYTNDQLVSIICPVSCILVGVCVFHVVRKRVVTQSSASAESVLWWILDAIPVPFSAERLSQMQSGLFLVGVSCLDWQP